MAAPKFYLDSASKAAPTQPVVARMYDWYLGGTHSYEIDRQAAAEVQRVLPKVKSLAIENRAFLRRAVRWLARHGVTQFIDMGSGLPTTGNTHETVLKINPEARILYVDIEQTVVDEGNEFIRQTGWETQAGMFQASALEPEMIYNHAETKRLIDFDKPVAIMMIALIHFFQPPQYIPILNFWKSKLVKGSVLVMTHVTTDDGNPVEIKRAEEVYARTPTPIAFRPRDEIASIMDGWTLVKPGVVKAHTWRVEELEEGEDDPPRTEMLYVAVGSLV